jgi:lysophospholipid acyltransferase (LPLAT)-like uncharacterized protein
MMPLAYPGKRAHVLISQHRDGELIHRIIARFDLRSVRGSPTRRRIGISPSRRVGACRPGPRSDARRPKGPRQVVKEGVIRRRRRPTFLCARYVQLLKKVFASWDRFQVPYPWPGPLSLRAADLGSV